MKRFHAHFGRAAALVGLLAAIGSGPVVAAPCASSSESEALDARALQTELVVAALSCGENERYNAFVGRFEGELVDRAGVMKEYFARSYGGQARTELNKFITILANDASRRSLAQARTFCANASQLFELVLKLEPDDLIQLATAHPNASSHGVPECERAEGNPLPWTVPIPQAKPELPTEIKAASNLAAARK